MMPSNHPYTLYNPTGIDSLLRAFVGLLVNRPSFLVDLNITPSNSSKVVIANQPNEQVYEFYKELTRKHPNEPIVALSSARWYWNQEDAKKLGIDAIVLWEPRFGQTRASDAVPRPDGYGFFPAPQRPVIKNYHSIPPRRQ